MSTTTGPPRFGVVATVLASQALRGVAYGLVAVQLGAVLRDRGLNPADVGLTLAAIVAGSALASLALGRWADRLGRARCYGLLYVALAAAGVVLASGWPMLERGSFVEDALYAWSRRHPNPAEAAR
jgi:MFS family permease